MYNLKTKSENDKLWVVTIVKFGLIHKLRSKTNMQMQAWLGKALDNGYGVRKDECS